MKKMGVEYMYRRRYIWVDPADLTFHWCVISLKLFLTLKFLCRSKIPDRSSPHKRIKVTDISHVRVVPPFRKIFFQSTTSEGLMWTIELTGDIKIDIMVIDSILLSNRASLSCNDMLQMENLEESNDWIKVLNLACGSRSKSNQQ